MAENEQKIANLERLNAEQRQAVIYKDGPLLIVAGAGTGKTTVITERIAWLIEEKLARPEEILALTFTDKAAGEMEERVDKALPYGYVDLWVMTFHAFAERILKEHALDIGVPNDFRLLTQTEQWLLVRANLEKFKLDYYRPLGNPTKFIHALVKHFSRCKDEEIWPEDYLEYAEKLKINLDGMEASGGKAKGKRQKVKVEDINSEQELDSVDAKRLEEVANAYHIYQQLLLDNNTLDFGDLINYTLKLFRTRPKILKKYQEQFKYILVDEFQDTNFAQYELVKLLAGERKNLTVVGDDDQSIYKFRGASVSNILQFKDDYPEAAEVFLTKNYRSSQNILDLAYGFIQLNNPERLEVRLQEIKKSRNQENKLSKRLQAQTSELGEIEYYQAADENGEVEWVVNKIIDLKNNDLDASWNDFAILVRANNQAEAFIAGLSAAEAPFNFVASKGLYGKEVVRDVLAYLKLLDNYHESMAMWRILNLPMMKIRVEDLMEISRFADRKAYSIFEALKQLDILNKIEDETKRKAVKILSFLAKHASLSKEKSVKEVVLKFMEDFGYSDYLLKKNDHKAFGYLNSLLKKMEEFARRTNDGSISSFSQLVEWEMESGEQGDLTKDLEEGPEAVKIMTVHTAKGLEFKYVFVVNLADKRFPSLERKDPIEIPDELVKEIMPVGDIHLQEERRLFYVAMTRAKQGLYLTSAENYGGKTKKKPSRFIYEIQITENTKSQKTQDSLKHKNIKAPKQDTDKIKSRLLTIKNYGLSPYGGSPLTSQENFKQKIGGQIADYRLPSVFSYSQLKAFEICPYQYYLNFILKVPTKGNAVFSYGKTMHITLQRFFSLVKEDGQKEQVSLFGRNIESRNQEINKSINQERTETDKAMPSFGELLKIYKESWIDDWYENKWRKEEYRARGEKSLKHFYEGIKNEPPAVAELEKGFNLKVGAYTIRGVIDRVDRLANGKIAIIDYKTGEAKSEEKVDKDQLLIYQMAGAEVFGWEVERLVYYYLDNNQTVTFLGSEKELNKTREKIITLIDGIMTYDFTATPSQHTCRYCDFKEICEYREI